MMENSSNNYFKETYQLIEKYVDDRVSLIKIQTAKKWVSDKQTDISTKCTNVS